MYVAGYGGTLISGLCLEVGIVHPGPRKHWDGNETTIPFVWDCWLFCYHPGELVDKIDLSMLFF